jgi:GNAT superfamily N-acetyltransferase
MTAATEPEAITIRAASADDHDRWLPLWHGYLTFYKANIDPATTDETWRRFHDPAEPIWAALAWRDGQAVGLVHWILHRSTWTVGDYCYLQDLFVEPGMRGGGIGRRLITHVTEEAERAGCSRVYWLTHETNREAMVLYDQVADRSGFVQYRKLL